MSEVRFPLSLNLQLVKTEEPKNAERSKRRRMTIIFLSRALVVSKCVVSTGYGIGYMFNCYAIKIWEYSMTPSFLLSKPNTHYSHIRNCMSLDVSVKKDLATSFCGWAGHTATHIFAWTCYSLEARNVGTQHVMCNVTREKTFINLQIHVSIKCNLLKVHFETVWRTYIRRLEIMLFFKTSFIFNLPKNM